MSTAVQIVQNSFNYLNFVWVVLPLFPLLTSSGSTASLFNLLVLIASMAGSLVAVFGGLLAFLEGQLEMRSVHGAPLAKNDVIRYHSERTEELECEVAQLKKTISLLAQIASPTLADSDFALSGIDLHGELRRQLAFLVHSGTPSDSSNISKISIQTTLHQNTALPDHDHTTSKDSSLRSRRWSKDEGWVGCHVGDAAVDVGNVAAAVEMTRIAARNHDEMQHTATNRVAEGDLGNAMPAADSARIDSNSANARDFADVHVDVDPRPVHMHSDSAGDVAIASPSISARMASAASTSASDMSMGATNATGSIESTAFAVSTGNGTGSAHKIARRPAPGAASGAGIDQPHSSTTLAAQALLRARSTVGARVTSASPRHESAISARSATPAANGGQASERDSRSPLQGDGADVGVPSGDHHQASAESAVGSVNAANSTASSSASAVKRAPPPPPLARKPTVSAPSQSDQK
jgi:hypothetical protein